MVLPEKATIVIDDREKAVIPYFHELEVSSHMPPTMTYKVERVTHGDYSIVYGEQILFIIERKTWRDMASSIKDGRSKNVEKLKKIRNETGAKILYIIEGTPIPSAKAKYAHVPYKSMRAHLDHLMFRDDIHIVHSRNQKGTALKLMELTKNYLSCKELANNLSYIPNTNDPDKKPKKGGALAKLKEKIIVTAEEVTYKLWGALPNVTEKTACLFVNAGWHISDLILENITKEDVFALKYDNGYVIGKRATKIWNSSRMVPKNSAVFVKILSQLHGVTKTTAEKILLAISVQDLLEGKIDEKTLADIQKSDSGRRVGKKVAGTILEYLVHPSKKSTKPDNKK
jgi:ERCC4-type nuclease